VDEERTSAGAADGEEKWMPVAKLGQFTSRTVVCARVANVDLIVIWNEGRIVAGERWCPHEQADLACGHASGKRLFCPRHAASFDLCDGQVSYGWPSRPLRMYPVRIADGQVLIDVEAIKTLTIEVATKR
jgi:3-phenylpropionate/trans-cinnamate dioxygenase ferredoxin component